ncbi:MAG: type IV pilus twitching motility protein PilT [Planctomycetota bacterium]
MEENLFGQILLSNNFVQRHELERAVQLQKASKTPKFLGEVLIEEGYITESILKNILSVQRRRMQLSDAEPKDSKQHISRKEMQRRLSGADILGFLRLVRELGASDLYLVTGLVPAIRRHGILIDLEADELSGEQVRDLVFKVIPEGFRDQFLRTNDLELSGTLEDGSRYRVNMFKDYYGYGAIFRLFATEIMTLDDLKLSPVIKGLARLNVGLILVTGPISSGKTSTLTAIVEEINQTRHGHIITIERPVEILFKSQNAIVTQREVGNHTKSFAIALRSALREDPDFIVVSELRDLETIATAIQAAETGHLVLGTLHTASAARTLHRIVDAFPENQQAQIRGMLSGTLRAIISQHLIPRADGSGRVLAQEILLANPAVSNLIRENRIYQIPNVIQTGKQEGMVLMDDALLDLVESRTITLEEAMVRAEEVEKFSHLVLGDVKEL